MLVQEIHSGRSAATASLALPKGRVLLFTVGRIRRSRFHILVHHRWMDGCEVAVVPKRVCPSPFSAIRQPNRPVPAIAFACEGSTWRNHRNFEFVRHNFTPRPDHQPAMTKAKRSRRVAALLAAPIFLSTSRGRVDAFVQRPANGSSRREQTQASTRRLPTPSSPGLPQPAGGDTASSSSDERSRTIGLGVASSACEFARIGHPSARLCCFLRAYLFCGTYHVHHLICFSAACSLTFSTHHFFTPLKQS